MDDETPEPEKGLEVPELDGPQEDKFQEDEGILADLPYASELTGLNSQLRVTLPTEQALSLSQRELSEVVDREARAVLLETTMSTRQQARFQCLAHKGAGDW